jgi:hypothetical protein
LFHNTWLARHLQPQFIVFDNGNMGEFKLDFKQFVTSRALKSNQLKITTNITQPNVIIERVQKVFYDMLRSFDLENNHENLEE